MLAPTHQMPSVAEDLRGRLFVAVPAILFLVMACGLLAWPERPLVAMLLVLSFGVIALVVAGPTVARRLRGLRMVPEVGRALRDVQVHLERGRAAEARERLEQLAPELANRLSGYRVVVLTVLAYTYVHTGDVDRGRAILDRIEQGGWHRAFVMRRARPALVSGQAILHTQLGDRTRAERMLALLRPEDRGMEVEVARAVFAARYGEIDLDALERLAADSTPEGRASLSRLVRLITLDRLPPDDPRRAAHEAALREAGKRPHTVLRSHWPELYAVAERLGVVGEADPDA